MKRMFLPSISVVTFLLLVFGLFAFVPPSAASDFFLHSSTTDFLDNTAPTATTAKFKDSPAVNRTTYQEIGIWAVAPAATWMRLISLSDLHVWIGLKNSDDQGTYFDLRAELRKNGVVIASGETKTIQGVTRNPALAKEIAVAFGPISGDQFNAGDVLSIKILTKVADSGGHNNAVGLRLYYDAVSRPSSFGAAFVTDTTPPTIAAAVNPPSNAAGWHKSDATVSFTCADNESGVASCPGPTTVTTEGANQLVSGTATDLAGNSATTSVSISLDKTAPSVVITSPSNGATVSSSPVNVTGTASDNLSGIAAVLCNGSPASFSAPTFSCDVPLTNGPNTITVAATDVAGNTVSSSITVTLGEPIQPQSPPVVFGPRIFTQPNEAVSFLVANPAGPFWLQVFNGQDGLNLVDSGSIFLNSVQVAGPQNFIQDKFGFQKDVTLQTFNTLEVELGGPPGSFLTVKIREAEPNGTISNQRADLSGINEGHAIGLVWSDDERAAEYVIFRADSAQGPWQELFRMPGDRPNFMDFTPDARLTDLCYKVEARDVAGLVIRLYEPICVPKFVEPQTQSFNFQRSLPVPENTITRTVTRDDPVRLASLNPLAMAANICLLPERTAQVKNAEPNPGVPNTAGDLVGRNIGTSTYLGWTEAEGAAEYRVLKSTYVNGPWVEMGRSARTGADDISPNVRTMDLCYKVEALDVTGNVIRSYEPVCVPKFVESQTQTLRLQKSPTSDVTETTQIQLTPLIPELHLVSLGRTPTTAKLARNNFYLHSGSFLQAQVTQAGPNVTVSNQKADLSGINEGHAIGLVWSDDERAAEYVIFRANSIQGPWQELFRVARDRSSYMDFTPDARLRQLCYRVEAVDASGMIMRRYEPLCVPKFVERQGQSLNHEKSLIVARGTETGKTQQRTTRYSLQLASLNLMADAPDPRINELCFANPDQEFTDWMSRGSDPRGIREFLESKGSFLQRRIVDVDVNKTEFDPAEEIFNAANVNRINPEVILTILQREQKAVRAGVPLDDRRLRRIMGWDPRDGQVPLANKSIRQQIADGAAQLRRDLDRLLRGEPTGPPGTKGWQVGVEKMTTDSVLVTPANMPTAVMYAYNPEVGELWGGGKGVGGNSRFCDWWEKFGFKRQPVAISPQNPTLVCGPDASVTVTASGGRPGPDGYQWSITGPNLTTTEGVLTVTGVDKQNVQIKPPETNPGIQDTAYNQWTCQVAQLVCAAGEVRCRVVQKGYSCADVFIGEQRGCGGAGPCKPSTTCEEDFPFPQPCPGNCVYNSCGDVCALRSQTMIAQGCRPCRLEMRGVSVRVTDAAGASATTTMTAE